MATVRDTLVVPALLDLGVIAPGEDPTDADAQECLRKLNQLMDDYAAQQLAIYTITRSTWTITSNDGSYTVGSGGDVNIARPVYVDHVTFQDTSPTLTTEYQLQPITDDDYSRITLKTLTAPFPQGWYYNPTYPTGTLILWPTPTSSTLQGVIYAATAISEFSTLDTAISLPPAYRRMLQANLTVEIAPMFEKPVHPTLARAAEEATANVKRVNLHPTDLRLDVAVLRQGYGRSGWSIFIGP